MLRRSHAKILDGPWGEPASNDRRAHPRHTALLRVALLHTKGANDLCVVKNISPTGLSARVYRDLAIEQRVEIEFRSGERLEGSVVWQCDRDVGILFPTPIDVDAVLASRWVTENGRRRNLPRIQIDCEAKLTVGSRSFDVWLQDISQAGAKIKAEVPPARRSEVSLSLPDLSSIAGVVQWVRGNELGISFNECISFERLARWIQALRDR